MPTIHELILKRNKQRHMDRRHVDRWDRQGEREEELEYDLYLFMYFVILYIRDINHILILLPFSLPPVFFGGDKELPSLLVGFGRWWWHRLQCWCCLHRLSRTPHRACHSWQWFWWSSLWWQEDLGAFPSPVVLEILHLHRILADTHCPCRSTC